MIRFRTVAVVLLASLALVFGVFSAPAQAALVAHWTFDNEAGGTVPDVTGNGHDGTLQGGAALSSDFAPATGSGKSLALSASNAEHLFVPADPGLDSQTFTLVMFLNRQGPGGGSYPRLTSRQNDRHETSIRQDGTVAYYRTSSNWRDTPANVPIAADTSDWTHLAYVHEAGVDMKIYVDGVLVDTNIPLSQDFVDTFMHIGNRHNNVEGFQGLMDDVALYDEALGAEDIAQIATIGVNGIPEPSSIVLAVIGLLGCAALRRRRRS
ncbi:MAG: LamG domain-containing protein [Planctomycetes bacterium]|nr:LamG domain-containing protein [Planctomycetota bacterium]